MLGDERYNPPSSNIQILNNTVTGNRRNFYWWQGTEDGGMNNVLIDNNEFIESISTTNVQINNGTHINVTFSNNTITQTNLPIAIIPNCSLITFSNNTWSTTLPCR